MQQTIHGDCTELAAFVLITFLYAFKILFPGKLSAVFIILIKHKQDQLFLEPLLYLFSGKFVEVSPFFASVLLQIELNTLKLQNIQNTNFVAKNQETKFFCFWSGG